MSVDPVLIIGISAAAVVAAALTALIHRRVSASVAQLRWRRTIDVETVHWVRRTSYWGFPADSRNRSSRNVSSWESVTRWETKHEYSFGRWQTRSVPVTKQELRRRTEYSYEIPKRRYSHTAVASGNGRHGVQWPAVDGGSAGRRREHYIADFVATDGRRYVTSLNATRWGSLREHQPYLLRVTWYGRVLTVRARPSGSADDDMQNSATSSG